jgi:hypothetical protein
MATYVDDGRAWAAVDGDDVANYERCGFRILADDELGPELVALRHHEADIGLDVSIRVAMRRDL